MEQQAIRLKIAGKSYPFTLRREEGEEQTLADKEEVYRLAEREVNTLLTRFEQAHYEGFTLQDLLALSALQLAIAKTNLQRAGELGGADMQALSELTDRLDSFLNRP